MAWKYWNPHPTDKRINDCAVRAYARFMGISWTESLQALYEFSVEHKCQVNDLHLSIMHDDVERCALSFYEMTVQQFAEEHKEGKYLLCCLPLLEESGHAVCVENGVIYDTWDSGGEYVDFAYYKAK